MFQTRFPLALFLPAARSTSRGSLHALFRALAGLARQRRRLGELEAHLLSDIGVSAEAAEREARRRPWDVPTHWRS